MKYCYIYSYLKSPWFYIHNIQKYIAYVCPTLIGLIKYNMLESPNNEIALVSKSMLLYNNHQMLFVWLFHCVAFSCKVRINKLLIIYGSIWLASSLLCIIYFKFIYIYMKQILSEKILSALTVFSSSALGCASQPNVWNRLSHPTQKMTAWIRQSVYHVHLQS